MLGLHTNVAPSGDGEVTLFRKQGEGGHGSNRSLTHQVNRAEAPTAGGQWAGRRVWDVAQRSCLEPACPGQPASSRDGQVGLGSCVLQKTTGPCEGGGSGGQSRRGGQRAEGR